MELIQKIRPRRRIPGLTSAWNRLRGRTAPGQPLTEMPCLPIAAGKVQTLESPVDYRETILALIAQAKKRILIAALYLQDDDAGREVLAALYAAKKAQPQLEVSVFVDWHRAQRGLIGKVKSEGNAALYRSMAERFGPGVTVYGVPVQRRELMGVLRNSLYPGAKDESIKMVIGYCKASGLDPMQKPVHIVPMWDSKARCMRDVIMPGIGSYRTQAARSGEYAGISEPEFGEDVTETFPEESYYDRDSKENKKRGSVSVTFPAWCRVVVKRLLPNGTIAEFAATERWKENYATVSKDSAQPNAMWKRRPYAQLAKCAEGQALRKAFPEFGAQPTADEMAGKSLNDDETVIDAGTGEIIKPAPAAPQLPLYTDEQMDANLPKWQAAIDKGRTPGDILNLISSKYTMSEQQKARVLSLKPTPPQPAEAAEY